MVVAGEIEYSPAPRPSVSRRVCLIRCRRGSRAPVPGAAAAAAARLPRRRRLRYAAPPPATVCPPVCRPVCYSQTSHSRRWRLGRSIGCGGFGEIYAATRDSATDATHAVKVEPHSSGPLFSEMHCYHRVGRADTIATWQRSRRLRRLGMPRFVGSGSVEFAGERHRFMVMERLGTDLQQLLDRHGGRFPFSTALHIGLQVVSVRADRGGGV